MDEYMTSKSISGVWSHTRTDLNITVTPYLNALFYGVYTMSSGLWTHLDSGRIDHTHVSELLVRYSSDPLV
jgi:hypothetical protein